MLLPEPMSRVVIVGDKTRLDETIDVLYRLGAVHLIDHTVGADEGFSIGTPRPCSQKASERLLKIRATEKELGIVPAKAADAPVTVEDIDARISSDGVEAVQAEVFKVIEERNRIAQRITELNAKKNDLEILSRLPIDLELYSGYASLYVAAGTAQTDPSEQLSEVEGAEFFVSPSKKEKAAVAVFAKLSEKERVAAILSECKFAEIPVPEGSGSPADALAAAEAELAEQTAALERCEAQVAELSEKHSGFLVASEEELAIEVMKGETPLRIAVSDFSFVIDGWVPAKQVPAVEAGFKGALGDGVYMEKQEDRGRRQEESDGAEPRFREAPTKLANGKYAKKFEYAVSLVSIPKYNEIDPAALLGVFFPFFFGFMVGDAAYAIPFIVLGAYGLKVAKSNEFKSIATVFFFGGIWTFFFGTFFFGEMLGMHFCGPGTDTTITWESLLQIDLPDWFAGLLPQGHGVSKLHDVTFLLKLSVYMAVVHLLFSYIVGFINVKVQHGAKEALFEKGGWVFSFVGMVVLCYGLTELLFTPVPEGGTVVDNLTDPVMRLLLIGAAVLVVGIAVCWKKEKVQSILELPGIVGNILSYTRLAAIGMSKAGMALAFNYISIIMFGGGLVGATSIDLGMVLTVVVASLIFVVGHLMIWVLAILSAGLHALRLQYVESMNKYFTGGGLEYAPLAIKRKHTEIVETEA